MRISDDRELEKTLQQSDIHQQWEKSYRTAENEKFYKEAFDYIAGILNSPQNAMLLDAGCGTCDHSIRLAKHGFSVLAVDFSEHILEKAKLKLRSAGMENDIKLQRENILALSFDDEAFDYILCWGVLMHIPNIEKAISELNRVLKKKGMLVISEGNMFSLQSTILGPFANRNTTLKKTPAGLEYWADSSAGKILFRQTNPGWLKAKLKGEGFTVIKHVSGQFSELYTIFPKGLPSILIHKFNHLWFKYVKIPQFSYGNIIIAQKKG